MRVGSLFAGIGGFDLAARWMGWRTAWVSEIEPYASAVLKKHFPDAPNHGDITQMKGAHLEPIDILCGGFPCQDISVAGKGAGLAGARSGLWTHYARLIDELRPRYVLAENVSALLSRGLGQVLGDLHALGYDAEWHCVPASYVGALHRRDRIWIVAHPHTDNPGLEGWLRAELQERSGEWPPGALGASLAYPAGEPQPEQGHEAEALRHRGDARLVIGGGGARQSLAGATQDVARHACGSGFWETEPAVGRVADGIPARVDRLRCLGNTVVPQVPHLFFQAIEEREERLKLAA